MTPPAILLLVLFLAALLIGCQSDVEGAAVRYCGEHGGNAVFESGHYKSCVMPSWKASDTREVPFNGGAR